MLFKKRLAIFFVAILMLYQIWYAEDFGTIPMLLQVLAIFIVAITVWINGGKILISKKIIAWFLFGLFSLVSGFVIVTNKEVLLSSIITYLSFLVLCLAIYNLCVSFGSTKWLTDIVLIANMVCALSVILFGEAYNNGIQVKTMGPLNNPNYLGISMLYGIFACLVRMDPKNWKETVFHYLIIGIFTYVIILSGSRSSLIGIVILLLTYMLLGIDVNHIRTRFNVRHIIYFITLVIAGCFIISYIVTDFINTAAFERLLLLTREGGTSGRTNLYDIALELFISSPFIGIGYNNFATVSGMGYFSHSVYAETLACTGIIGCILWFAPYFTCANELIKLRKSGFEKNNRWIALFVLIVFMGLFGITYYVLQSMVMFTVLFSQIDLEHKNICGNLK